MRQSRACHQHLKQCLQGLHLQGDKAHPPEATVRMSTGSCMIWTQRMLQALARGNDGRKWHTLIDKVYAPVNLRSALCTVTQRKTSPGIDGRSAASVARDAEVEVATLERLLREGKYLNHSP